MGKFGKQYLDKKAEAIVQRWKDDLGNGWEPSVSDVIKQMDMSVRNESGVAPAPKVEGMECHKPGCTSRVNHVWCPEHSTRVEINGMSLLETVRTWWRANRGR